MKIDPKKQVSHTIAWSLIALAAGTLMIGTWVYYNQISSIYDSTIVASQVSNLNKEKAVTSVTAPKKTTPNVVAFSQEIEPTDTGDQTGVEETALTPNISFSFLPQDGKFPHPVTVKLNDLGKKFYQNETKEIWTLGDGDLSFVSFDGGTYWSNYDKKPSLDRYINDNMTVYLPSAKVQGNECNNVSEITKLKVGGLDAAKFTVEFRKRVNNKCTDQVQNSILIVDVQIFDNAQKPLQIGAHLDNISEADVNKIIKSIVIDK